MEDDYITNSHYLTYTFLKDGKMYFLNMGVKLLSKYDRYKIESRGGYHVQERICALFSIPDFDGLSLSGVASDGNIEGRVG